jgi:hypothetical protein
VSEPDQQVLQAPSLEALDTRIIGNAADATTSEVLLIDDPVTGVGNEDLWEAPECAGEGGGGAGCAAGIPQSAPGNGAAQEDGTAP